MAMGNGHIYTWFSFWKIVFSKAMINCERVCLTRKLSHFRPHFYGQGDQGLQLSQVSALVGSWTRNDNSLKSPDQTSISMYIIILQYYTHVYTSRFHCSLVWFHTIWVKRRYVLLWANAVKSSDWLWTSGCWDIVDRFEPEITVVFNVLHVFVLSKTWGLYIVLYNMWFWWTFRQDWNYGSMEPR